MNVSRKRTYEVAVWIGIALAVLGVGAYVATDFASFTALIPAIFGVLFVALGRIGLETGRDRLATYGLAALAVLGAAGSARVVGDVATLATGGSVESPVATTSQALMALLCLVVLAAVGASVAADRRPTAR